MATPSPAAVNHPGARPGLRLNKDLDQLLQIDEVETPSLPMRKFLKATLESPHLPGQPRIRLNPAVDADPDELLQYLRNCHLTDELDGLLPFTKYIFVQTPSYRHIMPLHHNKAHDRKVVVDEHPGLHLLWYYDRIFIKPIPAYFYSKVFWDYLETADPQVHKAALGFMRSYYFLIQYQIDFNQACEMSLVPKKPRQGNHPTYEEFYAFIAQFKDVDDVHTCRRYHFGELRLTRIDKAVMLFSGHLAYFHIYPQWGSFLKHIFAPLFTIFAVVSVVQVALAAQQITSGSTSSDWKAFISVTLFFPIGIMCLVVVVVAAGFIGILIMCVKDLVWANRVRRQKNDGDQGAGEKSYGMIW
ncbi:hypothetical protein HRG_006831 [Hirsutella rhossiliensis]|uniref:Subtilisin-like serine protease n=1 Tax=Hirsutella rhossiliensis TaxID=111463 RepID=A0A9P8MWY1_9HYPO|nr:uncharacterized protein HRG_06831 [Hirsutella rhossiliensis]KAH0961751.1 hypothetical protein HRG_06831 [Hirsutella rhossiliensis]